VRTPRERISATSFTVRKVSRRSACWVMGMLLSDYLNVVYACPGCVMDGRSVGSLSIHYHTVVYSCTLFSSAAEIGKGGRKLARVGIGRLR
jgi:hypothetical protein